MTTPVQVIAATLPAPPTAAPAAPAPPIGAVPMPTAPLIVIDGAKVPVIRPYALAAVTGLGMLAVAVTPTASPPGTGTGVGMFAAATTSIGTAGATFPASGSASVGIAGGPGSAIVVSAPFSGAGGLVASNAAYGGTGGLGLSILPNSQEWPSFYATGAATAAISYVALFSGTGSTGAPYTQSVGLTENQTGTGGATATIAVRGSAVLGAHFGGAGQPASTVTAAVPLAYAGGSAGALTAQTGAISAAGGIGALTAVSGGPALFGSTGTTVATVSIPAAFSGSAVLTVTDTVIETAAFSGSGALVGPNTSGAASGVGALSAVTGGLALFGTAGTAAAATGGPVGWSGTGGLSAVVTPGFAPAGMTKNPTQATSSSAWAQVQGWVADTANYPGSTTSSNALVALGGKAAATVTGTVAWTAGMFGNSIQVRLKKNNTVIVTGTTSSSSPSTATTSVAVANGDLITVEVIDNGQWSAYAATISSGAGTFVHIT
ncbi:hypothetical protein [Nocardia nova]|uniref:hypothetical protein n=1 Tax=Nocardia nova TaxID=37330 RepID=UPI0011B0C87A|nr:hypothetical protein [Nocardia nova]